MAEATQCLTDTFTITNQENLPVICGINSGYHVYFGKFYLCLFLTNCYLDLAYGIQRPIWKLQKILRGRFLFNPSKASNDIGCHGLRIPSWNLNPDHRYGDGQFDKYLVFVIGKTPQVAKTIMLLQCFWKIICLLLLVSGFCNLWTIHGRAQEFQARQGSSNWFSCLVDSKLRSLSLKVVTSRPKQIASPHLSN